MKRQSRHSLVEVCEPRLLFSFTPITLPPPANGWEGQQQLPSQMIVAPNGNLWIADPQGPRIEELTRTGQATEFPLGSNSAPIGVTVTTDGTAWFADMGTDSIGRITPGGTVTEYQLGQNEGGPVAIAAGPHDSVWFVKGDGTVGRIGPQGQITLLPKPTGSDGTFLAVDQPGWGMTISPAGDIFLAGVNDGLDQLSLERVSPSGRYKSAAFEDGPATNALLWSRGQLWAATSNGQVDRVSTSGHFKSYSVGLDGVGQPATVTSLARGSDGHVWFASDVAGTPLGRIVGSRVEEFSIPPGLELDQITAAANGPLWLLRGITSESTDMQAVRVDLKQAIFASVTSGTVAPNQSIEVASLTDLGNGDQPSDFEINIDWGDASVSMGAVRRGRHGTFEIFGTHGTAVDLTNATVSATNTRTGQTVSGSASAGQGILLYG